MLFPKFKCPVIIRSGHYLFNGKMLTKKKANGTIGKLELSFSPKTVFKRFLNEFHCIYSYKLEWKDIVMKYSPSIKLCPKLFALTKCPQPQHERLRLSYYFTFITCFPHKVQGNKIRLSFALWKAQHWH